MPKALFDILLESISNDYARQPHDEDKSKLRKYRGAVIGGAIGGAVKWGGYNLAKQGGKSAAKLVGAHLLRKEAKNRRPGEGIATRISKRVALPVAARRMEKDIKPIDFKKVGKGALIGAGVGAVTAPAIKYGLERYKKSEMYKRNIRQKAKRYLGDEYT